MPIDSESFLQAVKAISLIGRYRCALESVYVRNFENVDELISVDVDAMEFLHPIPIDKEGLAAAIKNRLAQQREQSLNRIKHDAQAEGLERLADEIDADIASARLNGADVLEGVTPVAFLRKLAAELRGQR